MPVAHDHAATLIATPEAAAILGVSRRTMESWRRQRYGPPWVRLGRRGAVRYRRAEIERWIEQRAEAAAG